jgi:YD repeat-containing protein
VPTTQSFSINVGNAGISAEPINKAPEITSTPGQITNLEREYAYNLSGKDADGDLLLWSLDSAPAGMLIDATTGALRWQPRADQLGQHTVKVRLTDALGAFVGQEFSLIVNGINTPPQINSTPKTIAAVDQPYIYQVIATDAEGEEITYSLGKSPVGMTIDSNGVIRWTPKLDQLQEYEVEVIATDKAGASAIQTYTVEVAREEVSGQVVPVAGNNAPTITSSPVFLAATNRAYSYQVVASDADVGDILTYQLIKGVAGMTINASTGLLTWNNPVAGSYEVIVGAVDAGGLGAAQRFTLTARSNNAPVINSTAVTNETSGTAYSYDVKAVDADGDRITYSLDTASLSKGMTLDNLGRLRWNPAISNVGSHNVVVSVADGNGGSTSQSYSLVVAGDAQAPKVSLIASYDLINQGETVTFQARVTDNIKVASLKLLINGNIVALDANGLATVTATSLVDLNGVAIATDTAGNTGQATFNVDVINPGDTSAPIINFALEGVPEEGFVTAPTRIKATINDTEGLKSYRLLVAPIDGGEFRELWRNDSPTNLNNQYLDAVNSKFKFDPSLLQNDSYILRLEATDSNNNTGFVEQTVEVAGDLKLGNFRLSFTDLTVPVTGIPITLTRTYDTLTSGTTDDFGYGWRMEFRDTDLRTSVGKPSEEDEILGYQRAFKDGTKVYITLPGGKREAFTFKPTPDRIFKIAAGFAGSNDSLVYNPSFVGDKGITSTLTVKDARILRRADSSEYVGLNAGLPYNPADVNFGGIYVLTTKEGTVYEIDAATGDLLTVTDTFGNKLTYTDAEISSSTGQKITFARDTQNRITAVSDPMGYFIKYGYDDKGNLISVTDRENNVTKMEYNQERSHYLDKIIDPLGRTGVRNEYGEDGRLKKIVDVNGKPVEMTYDPDVLEQKVTDQLGYVTTYIYDARGNVVTEINAEGQITNRKFNDDNYILETKIISDRSGASGFTKKYSYDSLGNMLAQEDALGNLTYYSRFAHFFGS